MTWFKVFGRGMCPFIGFLFSRGYFFNFSKIGFLGIKNNIRILKKGQSTLYYCQEEIETIKKRISNHLNKNFVKFTVNNFYQQKNKLVKISERIKDNKAQNKKSIITLLNSFSTIFYQVGIYVPFTTFIDEVIAKKFKELISNNQKRAKLLEKILATNDYQTINDKLKIDILNLGVKILKTNSQVKKSDLTKNRAIFYQIKRLGQKYSWIPVYMDFHQPWGIGHFVNLVWQEVKKGEKAVKKNILDFQNKEAKIVKEKSRLINKYKNKKEILFLIKTSWEYQKIRAICPEVFSYVSSNIMDFLAVIADRWGYTLADVKFLTNKEIISFLKTSKKPAQSLISQRKKITLLFSTNQTKDVRVFAGSKAEKVIKKELTLVDLKKIKEIKGEIAFRGKVKGKVRIVATISEAKKLKRGEILVASQTTQNFSVAFPKCAAIITDEGGITCHAAIISRELKIPCIVGTKIATQVLKDGDKVEVDAKRGIVRKI